MKEQLTTPLPFYLKLNKNEPLPAFSLPNDLQWQYIDHDSLDTNESIHLMWKCKEMTKYPTYT